MRALPAGMTTLDVASVVTEANDRPAGGGVDGAVYRAAGPELLAACRRVSGCAAGEARITPGFRPRARHAINAVGPVWRGGGRGEAARPAGAHRASLTRLREVGGASVAFPAISIGVCGCPFSEAARTAVAARRGAGACLAVVFACFDDRTLALHEKELAA